MRLYDVKITTQPTAEPVTLTEARDYLNLTHTADDALLTSLIEDARRWTELHAQRTWMTTVYEGASRYFPRGVLLPWGSDGLRVADEFFELPRGPVQSITSITYLDTAGTRQTLASTVYELNTNHFPARLELQYDQDWPDTADHWSAVLVTWVAGYASADDVPESVKSAIKMLVHHYYDDRNPEAIKSAANRNDAYLMSVKSKLAMDRERAFV